ERSLVVGGALFLFTGLVALVPHPMMVPGSTVLIRLAEVLVYTLAIVFVVNWYSKTWKRFSYGSLDKSISRRGVLRLVISVLASTLWFGPIWHPRSEANVAPTTDVAVVQAAPSMPLAPLTSPVTPAPPTLTQEDKGSLPVPTNMSASQPVTEPDALPPP